MAALHDDDLDVDEALVRRLVDAGFPAFSGLAIAPLTTTGSTNALFRLGTEFLIRLPRQPGGSEAIVKEARWLPYLAERLTAPVPEVVAVGEPALDYPEHWLVTGWTEGATPTVPSRSTALARDLGRFVIELSDAPVPPEASADPALSWYRGQPLTDFVEDFDTLVSQCRRIAGLNLDLDRAQQIWSDAVRAAKALRPRPAWYHGDLFAENLLIGGDGGLAAVLDFGGLSVGDPTVDLAVAWEVLDAAGRETFRTTVGAIDAAWRTSMGWALLIALITFPYYWDTMPARCAHRLAMATAVLSEA